MYVGQASRQHGCQTSDGTSRRHSYTAIQTSTPWCLDFIDKDEAHVNGLMCAALLVFAARMCDVLVSPVSPQTCLHAYVVVRRCEAVGKRGG